MVGTHFRQAPSPQRMFARLMVGLSLRRPSPLLGTRVYVCGVDAACAERCWCHCECAEVAADCRAQSSSCRSVTGNHDRLRSNILQQPMDMLCPCMIGAVAPRQLPAQHQRIHGYRGTLRPKPPLAHISIDARVPSAAERASLWSSPRLRTTAAPHLSRASPPAPSPALVDGPAIWEGLCPDARSCTCITEPRPLLVQLLFRIRVLVVLLYS